MRIAIVDDNLCFAEKVKTVVEHFLKEKQEPADIKMCINGYGILGDVEENRNYDIYFLDVEMPAIDGAGTGAKDPSSGTGGQYRFCDLLRKVRCAQL